MNSKKEIFKMIDSFPSSPSKEQSQTYSMAIAGKYSYTSRKVISVPFMLKRRIIKYAYSLYD